MSLCINNAAIIHTPYRSGRVYSLFSGYGATITIGAADVLFYYPFQIFYPITFTVGYMRCITGGASSAVKTGIWRNSPLSDRPLGTPIFVDNTGQATTGSASDIAPALAGTLQPGIYWYGAKFKATLPAMMCVNSSFFFSSWFAGGVSTSNFTAQTVLTSSDSYTNDLSATTLSEGAVFTTANGGVPVLGLVT